MNKRKFKIRLSDLPVFILVGLLLYWLSSCGSGSSETANFSSDQVKERSIDTLSDKDFNELCQKIEKHSTRILSNERLCLFQGLVSETLNAKTQEQPVSVSNCTINTSKCLEEKNSQNLSKFKFLLDRQSAKSCGATFKELDACLNEGFSAIESFFSSLTCAFVGDPSIEDIGKHLLTTIPDTVACNLLQNKCPALFQSVSK